MPRERGPVVLFGSGIDTLSALEFHPFPRLFRDMQAFSDSPDGAGPKQT